MADIRAKEYAERHRQHLQDNLPDELAQHQKDGSLEAHLSSIGEEASDREQNVLKRMNDKDIQNLPYHQRVAASQSLREPAQEQANELLLPDPEQN